MTGKLPGRIGDTPLVGCGGYSDDTLGACSATGDGESIAKVCLCHRIVQLMDERQSGSIHPKLATQQALAEMKERTGGTAGAITLSKDGRIGIDFNSRRMAWAYVRAGELHYGINQGDDYTEQVC